MSSNKKKLNFIVITGPTATGKTKESELKHPVTTKEIARRKKAKG